MNQYYQYKELVKLEDVNAVFSVVRVKHSTQPNGFQSWQYQIEDGNGALYRENGESWIAQNRLKKMHLPSEYTWYGLKVLLNSCVEGSSWED